MDTDNGIIADDEKTSQGGRNLFTCTWFVLTPYLIIVQSYLWWHSVFIGGEETPVTIVHG